MDMHHYKNQLIE